MGEKEFYVGEFPVGGFYKEEFLMRREVFEEELSKANYARGNLLKFLYKILCIQFTFSLQIQFYTWGYSGKIVQEDIQRSCDCLGDFSMGGGGDLPRVRFSMWEFHGDKLSIETLGEENFQ